MTTITATYTNENNAKRQKVFSSYTEFFRWAVSEFGGVNSEKITKVNHDYSES